MPYITTTIGGMLAGTFFYFAVPKIRLSRNASCTVTVQAKIIDFEHVKERIPSEFDSTGSSPATQWRYYPILSYECNGQTYTSKSHYFQWYKPQIGRTKKIKIDPNNPTHFIYADTSSTLSRMLGMILFIVSILSLFK